MTIVNLIEKEHWNYIQYAIMMKEEHDLKFSASQLVNKYHNHFMSQYGMPTDKIGVTCYRNYMADSMFREIDNMLVASGRDRIYNIDDGSLSLLKG